MRPIRGLERPGMQWVFAALALVLIGVAIAQAVALRRSRASSAQAGTDRLSLSLERDELRLRLAREQSAREALAIEVSRLRGAQPGSTALPSLTLLPLRARGAQPPDPTVSPPAPDQVIELRLVLPPSANPRQAFAITIRGWSSGEAMWSRSGVVTAKRDGRDMVISPVAGDVLARGAYEVLLTTRDGTDVASYEVSVR